MAVASPPDAAGGRSGPEDAQARLLAASVASGVRPRRLLASRRRQLVAGALILGALGFLVARGLGNATEYFLTADQAVAQRAHLGNHEFRIEGTVQPGVHQVGKLVSFVIANKGTKVHVLQSGSPPQLFKPGIPVVLQGHWQGTTYASDLIMVKHTASYVAAHPDRVKPNEIVAGSTKGAKGAKGAGSTAAKP